MVLASASALACARGPRPPVHITSLAAISDKATVAVTHFEPLLRQVLRAVCVLNH